MIQKKSRIRRDSAAPRELRRTSLWSSLRQMSRCGKKILSVLLAGLLVFGEAVPALAADSTIYIRDANDLVKLAKKCSLDSWSQGKTVVLKNDIYMEGVEFTPIPSFGGVFDGGGCTISGLRMTGNPYPAGLFGIVQKDGVVRDLSVNGSLIPENDAETLGGIAGINAGKLINCTVSGTVSGKKTVGGLVGLNDTTGQIIQCVFQGRVSGEHYVGGIAGQNTGSILQCKNQGNVNTESLEISLELSDLQILSETRRERRSMENVPAGTDIGGIAGFSTGLLEGCQNDGNVGYEHIGYNVGGIVGRQSGYLHGCTNYGIVRGRKDVGGIAGQMEPQVTLKYDADTLSKLLDELDVMKGLMDQTLSDAEITSDSLSDGINGLTGSVRTAKDRASDLTDAVTDWTNGNVDKINDATARISWTISEMEPVTDNISDSLKKMERAARRLEDGMESLNDATKKGMHSAEDMKCALEDIQKALPAVNSALQKAQTAIRLLQQSMTDPTVLPQALEMLRQAADELGAVSGNIGEAMKDVSNGMGDLKKAGDSLEDGFEYFATASDNLADGFDILEGAVGDIKDILDTLNKKPDISFDTIDDSLTKRGDDLDDAFADMLDRMDDLNQIMTGASDTLIGDFKAINNQMSVIINVLRDGRDKKKDEELEDHFEDTSDRALSEEEGMGRIAAARNVGTVEGDINVAGVVGSLAIEYDFDPEDDLTENGDRSLDFHYQAAAVVRESTNDGRIKAKKNYAGGIVGRMDLGTVFLCEGYGTIESADGDYVGGIAGFSDSAIRNSFAKCTLVGNNYVGGILGAGSEDCSVMRCYVLPRVAFGESRIGAVSGESEGKFSGNYFSSDSLAGLGRVSYVGKAEPMEYEVMRRLPELPEGMKHFTLKFIMDDKILESRSFEFGDSFDDSVYPEVEAEEGCYIQWDIEELSDLRFDTEVTAVSTPYVTALTTADARDNGRSVFYIEGLFRIGDRAKSVKLTGDGDSALMEGGGSADQGGAVSENRKLKKKLFVRWGKEPLEQWELSFSDDGQDTHVVHYLPDGKNGEKLKIYVKQNGEWKAVSSHAIGQYLAFEIGSNDVEVAVFKRGPMWWVWIPAGVLAALILIWCRSHRDKVRGFFDRFRTEKAAELEEESI